MSDKKKKLKKTRQAIRWIVADWAKPLPAGTIAGELLAGLSIPKRQPCGCGRCPVHAPPSHGLRNETARRQTMIEPGVEILESVEETLFDGTIQTEYSGRPRTWTPFRGAWTPGWDYRKGDIVVYGEFFHGLKNNRPEVYALPPSVTNGWLPIARRARLAQVEKNPHDPTPRRIVPGAPYMVTHDAVTEEGPSPVGLKLGQVVRPRHVRSINGRNIYVVCRAFTEDPEPTGFVNRFVFSDEAAPFLEQLTEEEAVVLARLNREAAAAKEATNVKATPTAQPPGKEEVAAQRVLRDGATYQTTEDVREQSKSDPDVYVSWNPGSFVRAVLHSPHTNARHWGIHPMFETAGSYADAQYIALCDDGGFPDWLNPIEEGFARTCFLRDQGLSLTNADD